jgi:4-oxalocrotonate tautomerase
VRASAEGLTAAFLAETASRGYDLGEGVPGSVDRRRAATASPGPSLPQEEVMPLVQVKVIEGVFTDAQKRDMIRKLTDAMVSIEGESMRPVTWVVVEEVKSGDWGIGGKPLAPNDVKAMAGKPAG